MDKSKWEYKKLTDVCSILYGYPFDSKCFNENNQGRPLIRIRDVVRGFTETYTTEDCSDDYIIKEGEYLVGMDGEFNISAWKSAPALLNQRVCKITADGKSLTDGFMYYLMKTKLKEIEGETAFVTVKHLSAKVLNKVNVHLPSVDDQQRIAAELDCLNEMIALKQEQLKEFDKLAQSIFYDMFGDPSINNKGWNMKPFAEIAFAKTGITYKPDDVKESGIIVLRSSNVQGDELAFEDVVRVDLPISEKYHVQNGDILMCSRNGSARLVGKTAKIMNVNEIMTWGAFMTIIRSKFNDYLLQYFKTDAFRNSLASSKTTTVHQITIGMLNALNIPLPPLALQQQFAEKIQAIEAQKELVKQSIAETQHLFDSRMDYYFN